MSSLNKVILIARLGKDPEIRSFSNGGKVANLSAATSERWKDKTTGEYKDKTEWHRVAVFNENLVNFIEKYARKGSLAYIEGQLETRKWTDSDGKDQYSTEVAVRNFHGEFKLLSKTEITAAPAQEQVPDGEDIPF